MLIRISLVIAIIAGLAVGGLNFSLIKDKVTTLQSNLKEQTEGRQKAETELASTKKDLTQTTAELKQTKTTLEATTAEKDKAVQEASAQTKRADKLNEDLTKTRSERDDAQSELARYTATGSKPEEIIAFNKQIKGLQDNVSGLQAENHVIGQKLKRTENELEKYTDPDRPVLLPASLRGKIMVADPKWNFVVLNVGEDQRVMPRAEFLVHRDGKLVAKIRVSSVQKDRCVANVMPGSRLGEVMEGDQVIPANPES